MFSSVPDVCPADFLCGYLFLYLHIFPFLLVVSAKFRTLFPSFGSCLRILEVFYQKNSYFLISYFPKNSYFFNPIPIPIFLFFLNFYFFLKVSVTANSGEQRDGLITFLKKNSYFLIQFMAGYDFERI